MDYRQLYDSVIEELKFDISNMCELCAIDLDLDLEITYYNGLCSYHEDYINEFWLCEDCIEECDNECLFD